MMDAAMLSGSRLVIEPHDGPGGHVLHVEAAAPDGVIFSLGIFGSKSSLLVIKAALEAGRDVMRRNNATSPKDRRSRLERQLEQQRKSRNAKVS